MSKKVAVEISGGLDSSVTAFLLKKEGYDVVGITALTTDSPEARAVLHNAKIVAKSLDIPFFPVNTTKLFKDKVIDYFINSYKEGKTPNPCIMCNKFIKWGILYDYAFNELNADFVATGHYANIKRENGISKLYPASDEHKDQLYFLFTLSQEKLQKTLFPLSKYTKDEVRKIAIENNLPSKSSKESQDICFIRPPMTTKKYLNNVMENKKGYFIEKNTGKILGEHNGYWQYTVGQRKGIGIASSEPLYVISTEAETNTVFVGFKKDLFNKELILRNVNWSHPINETSFKAWAKIRYNMKEVPVNIEIRDSNVVIEFPEGVSAIATGQACVIYDYYDKHILGGAFIE